MVQALARRYERSIIPPRVLDTTRIGYRSPRGTCLNSCGGQSGETYAMVEEKGRERAVHTTRTANVLLATSKKADKLLSKPETSPPVIRPGT